MKARVKATGRLVEVSRFSVYCLLRYQENDDPNIMYDPDELDFDDITDWEQRRYEIAKEVYPLMIQCRRETYNITGKWFEENEDLARNAVEYADVLIAELKKKKDE